VVIGQVRRFELAIPLFLRTIEETSLSMWLRDTPSAFGYWFILTFHAIGMGLLVGASVVLSLRILGVARTLPIAPLKQLYPIIWAGFWIQVASGILLMIAFPTKTLTNPLFYVKMVFVGIGMATMSVMNKRLFTHTELNDDGIMLKGRRLAALSLLCWVAATSAGRFLAYTATHLIYPDAG
jgi:hypothetical protein